MKIETKKKLYKSMLFAISTIALTGCSSKDKEKTIPVYEYYIENNGVYTKLENVIIDKSYPSGDCCIYFDDGTYLACPVSDVYRFDITSEIQKELVKTLTNKDKTCK